MAQQNYETHLSALERIKFSTLPESFWVRRNIWKCSSISLSLSRRNSKWFFSREKLARKDIYGMEGRKEGGCQSGTRRIILKAVQTVDIPKQHFADRLRHLIAYRCSSTATAAGHTGRSDPGSPDIQAMSTFPAHRPPSSDRRLEARPMVFGNRVLHVSPLLAF